MVLELYIKIDVASNSCLPAAPSVHSAAILGNHFNVDICISGDDED